jgi:siderophore synthetase component
LIHPESENFYSEITKKYPAEVGVFEASSTASSRTVLVRPKGRTVPNFFAKLSLDVKLGGVTRTVPLGEVARSVGLSRYGSAFEKERPGPFTIMKEVMGISPKGWERGGMILRQIPDSVTKNKASLVPLFSLYAKSGNEPTVLEEMAKRAKMKPSDFFAEKILKPFYEGWVDWNVNGAITMEAHAQNVLLEVDEKGNPTGKFVHRDLGGFNLDTSSPLYKERAKLDVFTDLNTDYHQQFSAKARNQSLRTYFDGGFLFNVDKELERIEPGYKKGSIQKRGYALLGAELESATGLKISDAKLAQLVDGSADMSPVVDSATKLVTEGKASIAPPKICSTFYRAFGLSH